MKLVFRLIALCLFVVFFIFALKNGQPVDLNFLFVPSVSSPLALVLLGFFVVGAILGVFAMTPSVLRLRRETSHQRKQITNLQKELDAQHLAHAYPPQPDSVQTS